jgi:acyl-CoA synthetase (AMP-forming)/AMP-acid ligase II
VTELSEAQVMALFEGRLARYKHPRRVVFLDAIPRNAMGKVVKSRLREIAARS